MFLKLHRSNEKSPKPANSEIPQEQTGEEETRVKKIENLEELVNKRTKELQSAKEQLSQLSPEEPVKVPEGDTKLEGLFEKPVPPVIPVVEGVSLKVDPAPAVKEVEIKAQGAAPLPAAPEAEKKPEAKAETKPKEDSMADLFNQDETKENPLAGLIHSLPDVTAQELLNEAQEVTLIVKGWRRR